MPHISLGCHSYIILHNEDDIGWSRPGYKSEKSKIYIREILCSLTQGLPPYLTLSQKSKILEPEKIFSLPLPGLTTPSLVTVKSNHFLVKNEFRTLVNSTGQD